MADTFRSSKIISSVDPDKPHLILVGLPGAGTSTVGAFVGEKLNRTFLDFDAEIERRVGMPIAQIFGERGEAAFRALERTLTEELKAFGNMIVAPGNGWLADPELIALLMPPAKMAYLRVRPEVALKRLGGAGGRPLLNRPDPLGELTKLLGARRQVFQSADIEVGVELLTPQQVADKIVEKLAALK